MTVSVCQLPTELVLASTTQLNVYRLMLIYFWYTYNYVFYMCLLFHRPTEGLKREDHRVMNIIKQRGVPRDVVRTPSIPVNSFHSDGRS